MEKFAKRLAKLREGKHLSQGELAIETRLSQSAISYWEKAERIPNAEAIVRLSRYFGVTTDYLLGEKD